MYCKNCGCEGCQIVPEIARLRSELRGLRKARENAKASLDQAERELFRYNPSARALCKANYDALRRGLLTQAIVGESIDQLVDQADRHEEECQKKVDDLRSRADSMTVLEDLALDPKVRCGDVKAALKSIREAKEQLAEAEAEWGQAKKRLLFQQQERETYRSRLIQLQIAETRVERFDQDRQKLQDDVERLRRDLAEVEPKIQAVDAEIAKKVAAIHRVHRARRVHT